MLAAACLMLGGERKRATGKERKRREERKREVTIGKGGREAKERLGDQNEKWAQIRGAYVHTHRHTHTHTHARTYTDRGHACIYTCTHKNTHSYTHHATQQLVFAANLLPLSIASLLPCRLMMAISSVPRGDGV